MRQAHDAELIDLSKNPSGRYEVRVRDVTREPAPAVPVSSPEPEQELDADEPPQPESSAPPPPYSTPGSTTPAGIPSRSARFRRGSRGPRPASPGVPKVGVVEVDPTFRPRIEMIPVKPPVAGSGAPPQQSHPSFEGPNRSGHGGGEERPPRGRGGRGRGGRGRDGGGARERGERDHGSGGDREGGHAHRGGRGRGGRGRQPRNGESHGGFNQRDRESHREVRSELPASTSRGPESAALPTAPAPASSPRPAPAPEPEGESFWSRVKRGLIGGE